MGNVVVIGSQWGDEGKGKIVDWLSERADVVVRFQGGHNAGHTLVVDGVTYKLSLLPSGVVRKDKLSIIGNGVVVDPIALFTEIENVKKLGVNINPENLRISENAVLILPVHRMLDQAAEAVRGSGKIGTTGRGIGPAYEDKIGRRALRMCDLAHTETLRPKLEKLAAYHNTLRTAMGGDTVNIDEFVASVEEVAKRLLPFVGPGWRVIHDAKAANERILFEGAQGVMLDIDHGTYPFVTSSNTVAAAAATGSGAGIDQLGFVLGITKAYTTRVGSGPFPTELHDETGETLGRIGHEFGTSTGRKRRCGWFDAVQVRQAVQIGGVNGIALMKIDVMDTLAEIKICTGYTCDGKAYDYLPASADIQAKLTPVYETMPGWQTPLKGMRKLSDLPEKALQYIHRLEELTGVPAVIISTSPDRDDTIRVKDIF